MQAQYILYVYLILRIAQHLIETRISNLNYLFYNKPENQEKALKILGLTEEDLKKSLSYANTKLKFSRIQNLISLSLFVIFLYFGGFGFIERSAMSLSQSWGFESQIVIGLLFFGILGLAGSILSIPFDWYSTFVIEERFGFNKTTPKRFISDFFKSLLLGAVLGGIMLSVILWVMQSMGDTWWIVAWIFVVVLSLVTAWLYPTLLAPLFNKFTPLPDGELKSKIEDLAKKVGFRTNGLFVMNASLRSSHGNAYFTGVFGKKRIVLFDTLIEAMNADEVVAVLAHELGHFKLHHVRWALLRGFLMTGVLFFVLSLCLPLENFYHAFHLSGVSTYGALFVFSLWYGPIGFLLQPLSTHLSRRNEFAADAYAKEQVGSSQNLATALLKLREKSSSLPIYHPLYSKIYHSHPPMIERLQAMGYKKGSVTSSKSL